MKLLLIAILGVFMITSFTLTKAYAACAWYDVMCKLQGDTSTTNSTSTGTTTTDPSSSSLSSPPPTTSQDVAQNSNNCDSSYPDFCIPSPPPDLNCADIPQKRFTVSGSDPHGFDRDGDSIGCES